MKPSINAPWMYILFYCVFRGWLVLSCFLRFYSNYRLRAKPGCYLVTIEILVNFYPIYMTKLQDFKENCMQEIIYLIYQNFVTQDFLLHILPNFSHLNFLIFINLQKDNISVKWRTIRKIKVLFFLKLWKLEKEYAYWLRYSRF